MSGRCHYCGNHLGRHGRSATVDHIVPISRGGEDSAWNKVPACRRCNTKKAASWPTCECPTCQAAVARHKKMGTTADGPGEFWLSRRDKVLELRRLRRATRRRSST